MVGRIERRLLSGKAACLSVCHLSYGRNSHSILMKLYTVDLNPKRKIEYFPPILYPRNALSVVRCEHHSFEPCGRIVAFNSSRSLLGGRYTGDILAGAWCKQVVGEGHQLRPSPFPFPSSLPFLPSLLLPQFSPFSPPLPSLSFPSPPFPPPSFRSRPPYCG